ncbi:hypothetical protein AB0278_002013 [Escherichia coli]|nr:hypothetical protein [Escherichia coli]
MIVKTLKMSARKRN